MIKQLYYILYFGLLILLPSGCIDDPEFSEEIKNAGKPVFNADSTSIEEKTASSLVVSAYLTKENGAKIIERGFCYSQEASPTIETADTIRDNEVGIGSFTLKIKGLTGNTAYYIRPYATNSQGTEYGEALFDSTQSGLGVVKTLTPSDVYAIVATTGGEILDAGEGEIKKRGIYYSTAKDLSSKKELESTAETETYSLQLTGLTPATKYYVQAFVENTNGIFIGTVDSFITMSGLPVITMPKDSIKPGFTDATLTAIVTDGGDKTLTVIERGFCWTTTSGVEPTILDDTVQSGSGTGRFEGTITGLTAQQEYFARAYAKSNHGEIAYGAKISFYTKTDIPTVQTADVENIQGGNADVAGTIVDEGIGAVTSTGICWSLTNNTPTLSDSVLALPLRSNNTFSGTLDNLTGGKTYYIRAYATNKNGTAYGKVKQLTTPPVFETGRKLFPGATRLPNSTAYFAIGDELYLLGGDLGPAYTNELWVYSVSKDEWNERFSFSDARKWQSAITYGAGAFVYGGLEQGAMAKASLHFYTPPPTNLWNIKAQSNQSDSLYLSASYAYSNSLFFIGGKRDSVSNKVREFHMAFGWQQKPDFPAKQYGGVAAIIENTVYVGMGKDDSDVCNGNLWKTTDHGITWELQTTCPIYNGGIFSGVACLDKLYVIDEDHYILEYEPKTDVWSRKSQLPAGYREFHCMYEVGGKIYIGLGTANAILEYDPLWDN